MASGKSIMFQWEATPPRVYGPDGFIYKRKKKTRTQNLKDAEGSGTWKGYGVGGWAEGNVI